MLKTATTILAPGLGRNRSLSRFFATRRRVIKLDPFDMTTEVTSNTHARRWGLLGWTGTVEADEAKYVVSEVRHKTPTAPCPRDGISYVMQTQNRNSYQIVITGEGIIGHSKIRTNVRKRGSFRPLQYRYFPTASSGTPRWWSDRVRTPLTIW